MFCVLMVPSNCCTSGSLPVTLMPSSSRLPLKRSASSKPFNVVEFAGSPSSVNTPMRPSMLEFGTRYPSGSCVIEPPRKVCRPSKTLMARTRSLAAFVDHEQAQPAATALTSQCGEPVTTVRPPNV